MSFGQIAVIKDDDGFTNVRKLPNIDSEIIYKLKDSEVFSFQNNDKELDWVPIFISKNKFHLQCGEDEYLKGYIHKTRLHPIEDLDEYKGKTFSFNYNLKKFSLDNKICDFDGEWLTGINGRKFYGTDGNIPKIEVAGIKAMMNGKIIKIPSILYEDIFECNHSFQIKKNKDNYIVYQWNSDGAGAYLIVWVFGSDSLKQRLILIP